MEFEWDEEKSRMNKAKHGYSLDQIQYFSWEFAYLFETQWAFGEERDVWLGPLVDDIVLVVTTDRNDRTRIISLRRATAFEYRIWKKEMRND